MRSDGEPTPKRIIFARPDGSVQIFSPACRIAPGETEEDYLAFVAADTKRGHMFSLAECLPEERYKYEWVLDGVHVASVHKDELKTRFRGIGERVNDKHIVRVPMAWRWNHGTKALEIDPAIAKSHILYELRSERNAKLLESDGDKVRLDEIGTKEQQESIRLFRQELRDLPAVVSAEIEKKTTKELEEYKPVLPVLAEI